jgi:hypothetical protein
MPDVEGHTATNPDNRFLLHRHQLTTFECTNFLGCYGRARHCFDTTEGKARRLAGKNYLLITFSPDYVCRFAGFFLY